MIRGWEGKYCVATRKRSDNRVIYGLSMGIFGAGFAHGVKRFTLIDIKNQ